MRTAVALAIAAIIAAPACSKDKGDKNNAKPQPAAAKEVKGDDKPDMPNKQANCPTTVDGATTEVEWTDVAVQITVKASGDALAEVAKRAKHLQKAQEMGGDTIEHTGNGTGGGSGKCPVVMKDTKIQVAEAGDRVVIMLTPLSTAGFDALKAEVSRRQVEAGGAAPTDAVLTGEAGWDGGVPGAAGADMTKERIEKLKKEEKKKEKAAKGKGK